MVVDQSFAATFLLAKQSADPVLEQLDPPRRTAVIMALLALVLTGLVLVACAMIGAHWVRRMARHRPGARRAKVGSGAAQNQHLRDALASVLPEARTDDTIQHGRSPNETKLDL
jgi:hypothetical protein